MTINKPFVGITGITSSDDVAITLQQFTKYGFNENSTHMPALGYAVNDADGVSDNLPRGRYIQNAERLYSLARQTRDLCAHAIPTVHYNFREESKGVTHRIIDYLQDAHDDNICRTIQINQPKPPVKDLDTIKEALPHLHIILQSYPEILTDAPETIVQYVHTYRGKIDQMLIDPSRGQGLDLDVQQAACIADIVRETAPEIGIVFAGGFSGENAEQRIDALAHSLEMSDFSVDAEGKLRTKNRADQLMYSNTDTYIRQTAKGLGIIDRK